MKYCTLFRTWTPWNYFSTVYIAFSDWPGVWTTFQIVNPSLSTEGEIVRVKLITTIVLNETKEKSKVDKTIRLVKHEKLGYYLELNCYDGSSLGIVELQPTSKKVMKARDFMNGLRGNNTLIWMSPPPDTNKTSAE